MAISSQKLPWIATVQNKTASRAFGVTYTNTTGRTLFVVVTIEHNVFSLLDASSVIAFVGSIGSIAVSQLQALNATTALNSYDVMVFVVPPGKTYELQSQPEGGATTNIIYWTESD